MKLPSLSPNIEQIYISDNSVMPEKKLKLPESLFQQQRPDNDFVHCLLQQYKLQPAFSEFYWQIGTIDRTQGWILHLSVIFPQAKELLNLVIPYLIQVDVPFKVPRNLSIADELNTGSLGSINIGKIVCIYPPSEDSALIIAENLIKITTDFRGPSILTDRLLTGIVYTRYGSFNPILKKNLRGQTEKYIYTQNKQLIRDPYAIPFKYPNYVSWPFSKIAPAYAPPQGKLLGLKYYPVATIKPDAKGRVIKALYFKQFYDIKFCIIKEGIRNMLADDSGRDIRDRLKWQYDLHKDLYSHIPLPEIIGVFEQNEDYYLVFELIKGIPFFEWTENILQNRLWRNLPDSSRSQLLHKFSEILDILTILHRRGYVHRDLTTVNVLIDRSGKLTFIDMELAWNWKTRYPNPPFKWGTPGFMSPV